MKKERASQGDVNRLFKPDVPRETLLFWAKKNLVEWKTERTDGRGIHREYSKWNLFQFGIVRELASLNISIDKIYAIMDLWFKDFPMGLPMYLAKSEYHQTPASKRGVMEKCLVLYKSNPSLRSMESFAQVLCDYEKLGTLSPRPVTQIVINLPEIVEYVESRIREEGI